METITVDQLKEKILGSNPVNIIDVRTDEETAMGTIPGAKTIPMDQIADNLNQFNKMKRTTSFVLQVFVVKKRTTLKMKVFMQLMLKVACKHGVMKVLK